MTIADLGGTFRSFGARWRWTTEHLDTELWCAHGPDRITLADLAAETVAVLGGSPTAAPASGSLLKSIEQAGRASDIAVRATDDRNRLHDQAHEADHLLRRAGRAVHTLGAGSHAGTGIVVGVHGSPGGVPKVAMDEASVGLRGLSGDRQKARVHHGRLWQAVSIWSNEVINGLRREGHHVRPGAAGENLTVSGIDWADVRPGARLQVGHDLLLELTAWATPCAKNAQWFTDGDPSRMDHDRHPGWSRAYAAVLRDGLVRPGDRVEVEPLD